MRTATADLVIHGATVLDGKGGPAQPDTTVVMRNGRISALMSRAAADGFRDASFIDGRGKFVMPGLIDTHVHAASDAELAVFVRKGVTSIRYAGNAQSTVDHVRRRAGQGALAPRIFSCGPMIDTPPASYPELAVTISTPRQAAAAARNVLLAGADSLLVVQGVTAELAVEVVAVATDAGVPVFGQTWHLDAIQASESGLSQLDNTSRILVSSVLSTSELLAASSNAERISLWRRAWATVDWAPTMDMQQAMLSSEVAYCPSLIRAFWAAGKDPATAEVVDADEYAAQFSKTERTAWAEKLSGYRAAITTADRREWDRALDNICEWIARFSAAGGRVVTGSDSNLGGISFHLELVLLRQLGLSDNALVLAATSSAAHSLGTTADVGVLEAGRHGDCLVLAGDPRADIRAAQRPEVVVIAGRVVHTSAGATA
jgi:imidazolonepropionase-like amidohydrolase